MLKTKKITNTTVITELKNIQQANSGLLLPEAVVQAARHPSSSLHDFFEWDDSAAAQSWRLQQARSLINVCVEVVGENKNLEQVQVFVSLRSDRSQGGYRRLVSVLSNKDLREQLLEDAFKDMSYFEDKYKSLKELAQVFSAMSTTRARLKKP